MTNSDFHVGDRITLMRDERGWRGEIAFADGKGMYSTSAEGKFPTAEEALAALRQAAVEAARR